MTLQRGQAAYLTDMLSEPPDLEVEPSEIVTFFTGCNVLVTGGSGFIGKLIVEKLLRVCPNMGKLYMLMRAKKEKSSEQRFNEHFEDVLYERLKKEQPKFIEKLVMIEGDMGEIDLGLSQENRELLRNIHIIFHAAATVRFDEKLRLAVNINVRGTKELLLFTKEMPNFKAFVHISTAFSQCVSKVIDEKFYPSPIDSDKLITLVNILDDAKLERLTPVLLEKWPNTYTFTKAVAEDTIRRYSSGIPICIVRPSIIIATWNEPISGWISNLYGPTGVVVGVGVGLLRTLHCNANYVADIIPADLVINNIVAAAWDTANEQRIDRNGTKSVLESDGAKAENPLIYNTVSSCQNPITWGQFMKLNEIYGISVPSPKVLWYYCFTLNKHWWIHNIYLFFLHLVPAAIVDTLAFLTGRKPILFEAYRKIHKFSVVISYFSTQQWTFRNDRVMRLWEKLSPVDRVKFDFNLHHLDWENYFFHHVRGLRVYLLKDSLDTLEAGVSKYAKLKILHYTLVVILWGLFLWALITCLYSLRWW